MFAATLTPLSVQVAGYVQRVAVNDFRRIKRGELLVQIEDDDYQARVAQAEADRLGAEAAIENRKARKAAQKAQVAEAENAITVTQADAQRTRLEAERQRMLLATTLGTRQRGEQADADAERVEIGQRAEIRIDTFVVNAMVDSIAPASGAQFSLLPPDNATGNFTKVVQRIPVKLRIGSDNPLAGRLGPGMSVVATIPTDTTPQTP